MSSQKTLRRSEQIKKTQKTASFPWQTAAITAASVFSIALIAGGTILTLKRPDLLDALTSKLSREKQADLISLDAPITSITLTSLEDRLSRLSLEKQRLQNDLTRSENRIEYAKAGISDSIKTLEKAQKDRKKQASPQKKRNKKLDKALKQEQNVRTKLVKAIARTEEIISLLTEARRRLSTAGSSRQAAIEMALLAKADAFNSRNNASAQQQAQLRVAYAQKKLRSLNSFSKNPEAYIANLEKDLLNAKQEIQKQEDNLKKSRRKAADIMRASGDQRTALKEAENLYRTALNNKAEFERNLEAEIQTLDWKQAQLTSIDKTISEVTQEKEHYIFSEKQKRIQFNQQIIAQQEAREQALQKDLQKAHLQMGDSTASEILTTAAMQPVPHTSKLVLEQALPPRKLPELAPQIASLPHLGISQADDPNHDTNKNKLQKIISREMPPLPPQTIERVPTGALQSKKSIILSADPVQLPKPIAPAIQHASHNASAVPPASKSGLRQPLVKAPDMAQNTRHSNIKTPAIRPVSAQTMRQIDLDADIPDTVPTIEATARNAPKIPAPTVTLPLPSQVSNTLKKPTLNSKTPSPWALQVGAFSNKRNATQTVSLLKKEGFDAIIKKRHNTSGEIYMVRVQGFSDRRSAKAVVPRLKRLAKLDSVVVRN